MKMELTCCVSLEWLLLKIVKWTCSKLGSSNYTFLSFRYLSRLLCFSMFLLSWIRFSFHLSKRRILQRINYNAWCHLSSLYTHLTYSFDIYLCIVPTVWMLQVLPRVNIEYLCFWKTLTYVAVNREQCLQNLRIQDKILLEDAKFYDSLFSSWKGVKLALSFPFYLWNSSVSIPRRFISCYKCETKSEKIKNSSLTRS